MKKFHALRVGEARVLALITFAIVVWALFLMYWPRVIVAGLSGDRGRYHKYAEHGDWYPLENGIDYGRECHVTTRFWNVTYEEQSHGAGEERSRSGEHIELYPRTGRIAFVWIVLTVAWFVAAGKWLMRERGKRDAP